MIYVVIPVYNRQDFTRSCLASFRSQVHQDFKIVVVDDGSTDDTEKMLTNEFPEVHVIKGNGELWWTGAINAGIRYSLKCLTDEDYILVLNNDLELPTDFMECIVTFAKNNKDTLVGSVVVDIGERKKIVYGGVKINWWTAKQRVINFNEDLDNFSKSYSVESDYLTGRGTLIPVHVFKRVGLYDEQHFKQCGDTELTLRAKQMNYRLVVFYGARIFSHEHTGGDSINITNKYKIRDFKKYFFDVRSNFRLQYRFYFARSALRNNYLKLLTHFACDVGRISFRFIRNLER